MALVQLYTNYYELAGAEFSIQLKSRVLTVSWIGVLKQEIMCDV